jgi:hypothetical protein
MFPDRTDYSLCLPLGSTRISGLRPVLLLRGTENEIVLDDGGKNMTSGGSVFGSKGDDYWSFNVPPPYKI